MGDVGDNKMRKSTVTFGKVIAAARDKAGLTLRELATQVRKENGTPISYQYLYDIERDRRNPPSDHLIEEFARTLNVPRDFLYYAARRIPSDISGQADEHAALAAFQALREKFTSKV